MPANLKDLQKFYVARKTSIFQILPRPSSISAGGTFTFTTIRDAVQHFLAFSPKLVDFYTSNSFPGYHKAVMSILEEEQPTIRPRILLFDEWKDKFEGATTKKNRSGVHATTITFLGPAGSAHDPRYTYTISIGSGTKGDSRSMERRLVQSYQQTVNKITYFYDGSCRKVIPVLLFPHSAIQDRVERDAFNSVLSHTSPLTRRWGWVTGAQLKLLLPCQDCHSHRVQDVLSDDTQPARHCVHCCDLEFGKIMNQHSSSLLGDYPTVACDCGECPPFPDFRGVPSPLTYIVPEKLEHGFLKQALHVAYHHRVKSVWSAKQTATYLRLCGVNLGVSKFLELTVTRVHDQFISIDEGLSLLIPPAWERPIPIERYTEAPMHCLKGLGENVLEFLSLWLKRHGKNKHVLNLVNKHLIVIQRLQLAWLRVLPFGGKDNMSCGRWVSENYIDVARVLPFVMTTVLKSEATLPERAQDQIPIVLRFVHAFARLVGTTLRPKNEVFADPPKYIADLESIVKIFIFEFEAMERAIYSLPAPRNITQDQENSRKKEPSWTLKGNVISLLNFPSSARMFGPLTASWDGDREVFVRFLKPFLNNI